MVGIVSRLFSSSAPALLVAGALWLPTVASQSSSITSNGEFVYLERAGVLYQFDAQTLELVRRVRVAQAEKRWLARIAEAEKKKRRKAAEAELAGEAAALAEPAPAGVAAERVRGAISQGLVWLAAHQDPNGRWDSDRFMKHDEAVKVDGAGGATQDVGVTALAVLALLGDGNTPEVGPFAANVKRGLAWLRGQQDPKTGLIGANAAHDFIYGHAIATWALAEATLLTNDEALRDQVQRAADYLASHRNPYMVWRYQPRDNDNDTSVTAWCTIALKAAQDAKVTVDPNALRCVGVWLDQVTDPETGRHGYTKRGERSSRMPGDHSQRFPVMEHETLTAAGLFCRFLVGQQAAEHPIMAQSADRILAKAPRWQPKEGKVDYTFWAFGSLALYQMGDHYWSRWSNYLTTALLGAQRKQPGFNGSWDPCGPWGESGGRIYSTALAAIALQSVYRYQRLVRSEKKRDR